MTQQYIYHRIPTSPRLSSHLSKTRTGARWHSIHKLRAYYALKIPRLVPVLTCSDVYHSLHVSVLTVTELNFLFLSFYLFRLCKSKIKIVFTSYRLSDTLHRLQLCLGQAWFLLSTLFIIKFLVKCMRFWMSEHSYQILNILFSGARNSTVLFR